MSGAQPADRGETFVELLITVAILGIAVAAILGGIGTAIIGSDVHRKQSEATPVVISAADALKDRTLLYKDCATSTESTYVNAVAGALPAGWPTPQLTVRYWTGSDFTSNIAQCQDASLPSGRAQEITIQVTTPDARATETLAVVKRGN